MIAILLAAALAASRDWRPVDPQNALVVDTTRGRVIVELRPDLAPMSVARVEAARADARL